MEPMKHYLPTMSSALQAMCDGLEARHVEIDFSTFGERDENGVCYGCAATNTILHAHPEMSAQMIPHDSIGFHYEFYFRVADLRVFEEAIDLARGGNLFPLANFYCFTNDQKREYFKSIHMPMWGMDTGNYLKEIPKVRAFVERLKKSGL